MTFDPFTAELEEMIRSQVKKAADARARWEDDTYQDLMSRIDKARTMFNVELSSSCQHQQRIIGSNGAGKSYARQDVLQGHYQWKSCVFTFLTRELLDEMRIF